MIPADNRHLDLAAYAVGALDPEQMLRFEDHLADCQECAIELAEVLPVVMALDRVRSRLARPAHARPGRRRSGARRRPGRLLVGVLSALIGASLATAIGASVAGWSGAGRAAPTATASHHPPVTERGERFAATDPETGVSLSVSLDPKSWGTQIVALVGNVTGPRRCHLLAVTSDGATKEIATWRVPEQGYGTSPGASPLHLSASTDLDRTDIQRIDLVADSPDGGSSRLSSVAV